MQIAIFGTLVQTGIGVMRGFNERLIAAVPAAADAGFARRWNEGAARERKAKSFSPD